MCLPPLKCVTLNLKAYSFPTFLSPTNVPVLKYLEFRNRSHILPSTPDMSLSEPILVLALVTLSLSGDMPPWSLQSDSVHFPVLDTLKIWLGGVDDFFKAIVTPRLKSLDYTALVRFRRLRWPWRQVSFTIAPNSLRIQDAEALC